MVLGSRVVSWGEQGRCFWAGGVAQGQLNDGTTQLTTGMRAKADLEPGEGEREAKEGRSDRIIALTSIGPGRVAAAGRSTRRPAASSSEPTTC